MIKKDKIINFFKIFLLSFLGVLLGSLVFQYASYGIPANWNVKNIETESIESIMVSQDKETITITDKEEMNKALLFTNFLYIKFGKAENFIPTTEYLVKLKSGEIIAIGTNDKYIAKNGKLYKGNDEYLKLFHDVVKNIVIKRTESAKTPLK